LRSRSQSGPRLNYQRGQNQKPSRRGGCGHNGIDAGGRSVRRGRSTCSFVWGVMAASAEALASPAGNLTDSNRLDSFVRQR